MERFSLRIRIHLVPLQARLNPALSQLEVQEGIVLIGRDGEMQDFHDWGLIDLWYILPKEIDEWDENYA
jgi:hypothetical protein